jgi:hypothetical protein
LLIHATKPVFIGKLIVLLFTTKNFRICAKNPQARIQINPGTHALQPSSKSMGYFSDGVVITISICQSGRTD